MTAPGFELHHSATAPDHPIVVTVSGEVDVTNADDFAASVAVLAGAQPVVLDLSRLDFLDSAGFAALDSLLADGHVVIVVSRGSPIRTAAILMDLPFHDETDTALAAAR